MTFPADWQTLTEQPASVGHETWRRIQVAQELMRIGEVRERDGRCDQCISATVRQRRNLPCIHVPYTVGLIESARTWKCVCCLLRGQTCEFQGTADLLANMVAENPLTPVSWFEEEEEDDWRDFLQQEEVEADRRNGGLYLPEQVYQRWEDVPEVGESSRTAQQRAAPTSGVSGRLETFDEPPSFEEVEAERFFPWEELVAASIAVEPVEVPVTEVFELEGRSQTVAAAQKRKRELEDEEEVVEIAAGPNRRVRRKLILDSEDEEVEEIPREEQRSEGKRRMDRWLEDKVREFGEQLQTLQCLYEEISEAFIL